MKSLIIKNMEKLYQKGLLERPIIIWGVGNQTSALIQGLREVKKSENPVSLIVDNFKHTFWDEYEGIPVKSP